jgi:hypothetical protein
MPRSRSVLAYGALLAALVLPHALRAQVASGPTAIARGASTDSATATAEGTVRVLYRLVSFSAGEPTDWTKVRALFLPEAVVVLRTSRTATSVFPLDGFINDFVAFDTIPAVARAGFTETVVRLRPMVLGNVAHVLVLYEAHVTGSPRPPQQGVDSFHLVRRDGRWWIVSVVNEVLAPDRPLPAELQP